MRALCLLLLPFVLFGCDNGTDDENAEETSGRGVNYCVAYVQADAAASVAYADVDTPAEAAEVDILELPAWKRFIASAPEDLKDEMEILIDPSQATRPEAEAAGKAIEERMLNDCLLHEESPLSSECQERGVALRRSLAETDGPADSELEAFGNECRPKADPYADLDASCAAIVYAHFVEPKVEGVTDVGFPSNDDRDAIEKRFHEDCGG